MRRELTIFPKPLSCIQGTTSKEKRKKERKIEKKEKRKKYKKQSRRKKWKERKKRK